TVDGITQQYQYDDLGRLTSETQTLFGESFTLSYSYDQYSRPLQTTFPTGLTAKQVYNERGYLTAILDGNANTYWQAQAVDALGNITQQQYGNGATTLRVFDNQTGHLQDSGTYMGSTTQIEDLHFAYDELGNLTQREDKRQKIQETFAYDQLNRLTEVTALLSGNTQTTTVQYDRLGNIIHKSDVGNYRYAGKCGSQQAGPHALTQTTGSQNATYCYDANGNMTSGNGRTVRYTAFDKPDQIIRGDYQIDLVYGPDQKRVRRIDHGPTGTSTTYYQSGIYEKVVSDTGKIQHKHYIADVAIITKTENAGTDNGLNVNYFHRDHLSSITAITDQNGQVIERFSYDPWGKRRQTDWQPAIDFTQITSTITKRGFTNHEHLDGVGLIHMNGRVYDPNVGRFLSADPFIQFASNIQSYNRYSYILNNPLNGIDPTGFITEGITK
ncbi:RHS repeat-associated core domain-containing protein, partial [Zooshikella ganghwensis]|uniref:RHS repeat-associated core domain-containing protein n=1 Tax=Zooshikella ganghwensis TaxID=202772 RepID=UPI0004837B22